jgi:uncharacterized protein YyaL (SSP411 family)
MPITWLPWSADAFARARDESKPVLLSIAAAWCQGCLEMERTTFADPAVQESVVEGFVAIRVDADKRPDLAERYALGGLPTTAFLTDDGAIVGGGTYVPAERMIDVLDQVAEAFRTRRGEIDRRAHGARDRAAAVRPRGPLSADALIPLIFASYDSEHAGFGTGAKFPVTAPLHLGLMLCDGDADARAIVEQTLDRMADSALYDEVDGGFFRYATCRDWSSASEEKLLEVNAVLFRLYLEASDVLHLARYRDRAVDVLRYVQTWLADQSEGGWAGSQHAAPGYYALKDPAARAKASPPRVDAVLYSGWNGQMVSAALRGSRSLEDSGLGEFAVKSLERVLLSCYQPGGGVAHYHDGDAHVRGLLDDQVQTAAAALDAFDATGDVTYEMMAEELGHYILRTLWDPGEGGFFDRTHADSPDEIGLLRENLKPFVSNCEAARMLIRLAATSGDREFHDRAEVTLRSVAGSAPGQGPLAAHYVLAMRESQVR